MSEIKKKSQILTSSQVMQVRASLEACGLSLKEWCQDHQCSYWRASRMLNQTETATPSYRSAFASLVRDGQARMRHATITHTDHAEAA